MTNPNNIEVTQACENTESGAVRAALGASAVGLAREPEGVSWDEMLAIEHEDGVISRGRE